MNSANDNAAAKVKSRCLTGAESYRARGRRILRTFDPPGPYH